MKYTIKDFREQFTTDADCLAYIFAQRHPKGIICPKCKRENAYRPIAKRRAYACNCGHQISPTAGTIFHKSSTSLLLWFHAIFLLSCGKNGVSAKELQRQLGVTYKCAWRMAHQIRRLMQQDGPALRGVVEADETYIGGKSIGRHGAMSGGKIPVIGVVQRDGNVYATVATDAKAGSVLPQVVDNVKEGAIVITDDAPVYRHLPALGYGHHKVNHSAKEYVRGFVHTNTIEGFWSQLKRSINGTFHSVSPQHLQKYVNEFAYRYNRRRSATPMFAHLTSQLAGSRGSVT